MFKHCANIFSSNTLKRSTIFYRIHYDWALKTKYFEIELQMFTEQYSNSWDAYQVSFFAMTVYRRMSKKIVQAAV